MSGRLYADTFFILEFGIGYDDDVEHAERVLTDIVNSHEKILDDPEPMIKLHTLDVGL